ncbi:MAG: AsmA family protein [Gammaproteobacteria bacterium]|jgi:AsmA protein
MKMLRVLFKLLAVVVVVLLLALAALIFTFDPNNYKDQITAQVEKQTGRDFAIDGDISLSIFPWIGVKVENVKLANAEGFSKEAFARISQLDVKVMLLPLLQKELQVDKVKLHGLFASLEVDQDGNNNWSDLMAREKPETKPAEQAPETEQAPPIAALAINGIELVDATVTWNDAANNIHSSLSGFNLTTGAIRFNEPVDIQIETAIKHNEPQLDALLNLNTALTFNEAFTNILLDALKLSVSVNAPGILKEKIDLLLQSDINIDIEQQIATLSNTLLFAMDVTLHAELDVKDLLSEPTVFGTLHTDEINARQLLQRLQVELPVMAGAEALTKVAYASRIRADASQAEVDDIRLNLDDAEMTGWLHVTDISRPEVRYKLHMSPINADAYLPPPMPESDKAAAAAITSADSAAAGAATSAQEAEIELPVALLRELDLQGELTMDSVTVSEIPVSDILIKTQAKAGVMRADPIQFNTLEGAATASMMMNVNGNTPAYALGMKASEIQPGPVLDPVLAGIFGQKDVTMDGAANFVADIKTQGSRISKLKSAAQGNMRFDMGKTILQGVDFEYYVRNVVADYVATKSLAVPAEWRGGFDPQTKTAFNRVHASAVIANGDVTNKDLVLDSSRIKVKGAGVINIVRNDMDYNALIDIEPTRQQTTAEKLLDQPLSVRVHGPFEQLAYDIDKNQLKKALGDLLEAEAKAKVKKEVEEEKEKLKQKVKEEEEQYKQKLEDKLKDKLKGLF